MKTIHFIITMLLIGFASVMLVMAARVMSIEDMGSHAKNLIGGSILAYAMVSCGWMGFLYNRGLRMTKKAERLEKVESPCKEKVKTVLQLVMLSVPMNENWESLNKKVRQIAKREGIEL